LYHLARQPKRKSVPVLIFGPAKPNMTKAMALTNFSKSLGKIQNQNILMAVMTPPDCLKWPETP